MYVNREKLLGILEQVAPGLTPKDVIEQSSCLIFEHGQVHTFNEEILFSAPSPLGTIAGAVVARPFLDLLSKMQEDDVDITCKGGKQLLVAGIDKRAKIAMEDKITSPYGIVQMPTEWKPLDKEFCEAIRIVASCAAAAATAQVGVKLTCVHITPEFVEASDTFQIARYPVKVPVTEPILIRASTITKLIPTGVTEIAETPSWVHFRNAAGLVISCHRFLDTYNDLGRFLNQDGCASISLPGGLEEIVAKAEIFSGDNSEGNYVKVELRPDKMEVTGLGVHGWYQERKQIVYSGEPMSFIIAPKILLAISSKSNECSVLPGKLFVTAQKFKYCVCTVSPEKAEESKTEKSI